MTTLLTLIEAVKENNENNGASWADWEDAEHIFDVYLESESDYDDYYGPIDSIRPLLNRAIKSNGASLEGDLFDLKKILNLI